MLKAENDRLKSSGNATPTATPVKTARPPSETSSTSSSSSRQSLGLSLNNLNITDTIMSGQFSVSKLIAEKDILILLKSKPIPNRGRGLLSILFLQV